MPVAKNSSSQIFNSSTVLTGENYAYNYPKQSEKHISVISLIEQHKDNNRSGKSSQSFAHLTMRMHKTEDRTNFHSIQRLPSVIQVTYGGKLFQMCRGKISKRA